MNRRCGRHALVRVGDGLALIDGMVAVIAGGLSRDMDPRTERTAIILRCRCAIQLRARGDRVLHRLLRPERGIDGLVTAVHHIAMRGGQGLGQAIVFNDIQLVIGEQVAGIQLNIVDDFLTSSGCCAQKNRSGCEYCANG